MEMFSLLCTMLTAASASDGATLVERVVQAHGARNLVDAELSFSFRDVTYVAERHADGRFRYARRIAGVREILDNDGPRFEGTDGPLPMPHGVARARARELNSVVYFASLPLGLLDPAVRPVSAGRQEVSGEVFDVLEVRFTEEGGGDDHDDVFRYWVEPKTGRIAYMAYSFSRGGGGVRFRVPTRVREVEGAVFIDWDNFGQVEQVPLGALPGLWSRGELEKLSEIKLESIRVAPHRSRAAKPRRRRRRQLRTTEGPRGRRDR